MPDYSEYIVIKDGVSKILTNRRGDYTFLSDVFLGPEKAIPFIYRQYLDSFSRLDESFSGLVIDLDKQFLQFDLSPPEAPDGSGIQLIEVYLSLLQVQWPNWVVTYAKDGCVDRVKYLNSSYSKANRDFSYEKASWDEPKGTLLSIESKNGISTYWSEENLYNLVAEGPELFESEVLKERVPEARFPFGGIHYDKKQKKMFFWYSNPTPGAEKWAKRFWETHIVEYDHLGYDRHLKMCFCKKFDSVIIKARQHAISSLFHEIVKCYDVPESSIYHKSYQEELKIVSVEEREALFNSALLKNGLQQSV